MTLLYNNVIIYLIIQRILHVFMDVIPSEIFRGHLDTIILLSLVYEDKHTNQIREEIEERSQGQFELKQGTFYSCLQRIVKQGFVTEYRATSADGQRRKFYQLTEKGKSYIDQNKDKWEYSRGVVNILLETPEEIKKKEQEKQKEKEIKKAQEKHIEKIEEEPFDIDKELKKFLNSDIDEPSKPVVEPIVTKVEKPVETIEKYEPVVKQPEPEVQPNKQEVNIDKVTIINFSDISQSSVKPKVNEIVEEPVKPVSPVSEPIKPASKPVSTDFIGSPEEYDLFTLVGMDSTEMGAKNTYKAESVATKKEVQTEQISIEEVNKQPKTEVPQQVKHEHPVYPVKEATSTPYVVSNTTQAGPTFVPPMNDKVEEDDFYNGGVIERDYKNVLNRIFPEKQKQPEKEQEEPREFIYTDGTDINSYFNNTPKYEPAQEPSKQQRQPQQPERTHNHAHNSGYNKAQQKDERIERSVQEPHDDQPTVAEGYDYSDIKNLAKMEGFTIRVASNTTKNKLNAILVNKLVAISALIFYAFCLVEIALLGYFTSAAAKLTMTPFWIFASVLALFPVFALIVYFVDPKRKVANIATMKSVIELCIVIMLNLVLIMIVISIFAEVDFSSKEQLLKFVLYPSVIILNIPIYFIIKYLNLENKRFYE